MSNVLSFLAHWSQVVISASLCTLIRKKYTADLQMRVKKKIENGICLTILKITDAIAHGKLIVNMP